MDTPKRYKPPPVSEEPDCVEAWEELIEEHGYPMTCVGKTAQGYFSAGWEAAVRLCVGARHFVKPKKMPKG